MCLIHLVLAIFKNRLLSLFDLLMKGNYSCYMLHQLLLWMPFDSIHMSGSHSCTCSDLKFYFLGILQ